MMQDCCLLIAIAAGMVLVIFRTEILPERFTGDEGTIQELAQGLWSSDGDSSYTQVSTIYRTLGMADSPLSAGLFGFIVSCIPYILVSLRYRANGSNAYIIMTMVAGILLSSVYMGSYSKEVFIVPVVIAVILIRTGLSGSLAICALIALYAGNFRSYWFLVLILFAAFSILIPLGLSAWRMVCLGAATTLVGSFVFSLVMGVPSDHFRLAVNVQRAALGDVNTIIPPFVELGTFLDGPINNTLSFIFLQFPLPLLAKASPYYLILFAVFTFLWIRVFKCAGQIPYIPQEEFKRHFNRLMLIILSFAVTQAFFEPDYGSALKHLTPFLPLFFMMQLGALYAHSENLSKKGIKTVEFNR